MPPHEHSPEAADPLLAAHALAAAGDAARAYACLEHALARPAPTRQQRQAQASALAAVARAAERAGDEALARRALTAALERVDWADLHFALGALLVRTGERDAARHAFDRALAINPRYRAAAVERAMLDARDGRVSEAVLRLRELSAAAPAGEAALRAGLERLRESSVDDAARWLRETLSGGDAEVGAMLDDARARLTAGDSAGALARLREAVDVRPGYADLHALLGAQELRAGHFDDGIDSLSHALTLNPGFHGARLELARGLEARGERERALAQLREVLQVEPGHHEAAAFYERLTARRRGPAAA